MCVTMDPLTQDSGSTHPVLCMVSQPSKQFQYDSTYPEIWVFLTTPPLFIYKKTSQDSTMYPKLAKKYWSFCWSVKCWGHRQYFRTWVSLHVSPIRSCAGSGPAWSIAHSFAPLCVCWAICTMPHSHFAGFQCCLPLVQYRSHQLHLRSLMESCARELWGPSDDDSCYISDCAVSLPVWFLFTVGCLVLCLTHSRCSLHICRTVDLSEELCTRTLAMHAACIISLNKSRSGRMLAWSRMKAIKNSK